MFSGAAEELTVTFIPYQYARVRKIVVFATVTINFFCAGNQQFLSKSKCIFSAKWICQELYTPWHKEFKGDKQKCPCFPM